MLLANGLLSSGPREMLLHAVGVVPGSTVMRNYVDCLEVSYGEVHSLHAGYSLCFLSPADFFFQN